MSHKLWPKITTALVSLTQWGHYVVISPHNADSEPSVGGSSEKALS